MYGTTAVLSARRKAYYYNDTLLGTNLGVKTQLNLDLHGITLHTKKFPFKNIIVGNLVPVTNGVHTQ
jgi:hypothetical protein